MITKPSVSGFGAPKTMPSSQGAILSQELMLVGEMKAESLLLLGTAFPGKPQEKTRTTTAFSSHTENLLVL